MQTECILCEREVEKTYKHHVIPKLKGGTDTIDVCWTCSQQVHMIFSENELRDMSLEELTERPEMIKYLKWVKKKPREFSVKMSKRLRKKRRR